MIERSKCIFCQIVDKTAPSEILFSDNLLTVFRDIKPAAKDHLLIVPNEHIRDAKALLPDNKALVQQMIQVGKEVLRSLGADENDVQMGFHWPPFNTISHLHLHAIAPASSMGFFSRMAFKPNTWWFVTPDYVLSRL